MELLHKLKLLTSEYGVSGNEARVSDIAASMLSEYAGVQTDEFGNVLGKIPCGDGRAPTLLLDAHIDQIGFMVTEITPEGFLRFIPIGGVDGRMLPGSELTVLTRRHGNIRGVVGAVPPHLQSRPQTDALDMSDMTVDIGMTGPEARSVVSVGDYMCFAGDALPLLNGRVSSKALDDRACFLCILYALELLKGKKLKVDLLISASTKEELGGHGAQFVSERENIDFAVAVDVCHAKTGDAPEIECELSGGAKVSVGANSRPGFAEKVIEAAKKHGIPCQVSSCPSRSGTNAWSIQPSNGGICTLVVSLPLKYMHSPVEVLDVDDVKNCGALLAAFISDFDGRVDE
ncbi:MAG: M20/M25/M40 family metallo-hydrolase [Clostridia bacterium]|nr:M20/M25/M40 family metallo-hydrolase [Clostridia bacterium]